MSDKRKSPGEKQSERHEREAAALRENLRRRKAQSQAREDRGQQGGSKDTPG